MSYNIVELLEKYSLEHKSPVIEPLLFIDYAKEWIMKNSPDAQSFITNAQVILAKEIDRLKQKGLAIIDYNGSQVSSFRFLPYYKGYVKKHWNAIDATVDNPFPGEHNIEVPPEALKVLDVKVDFAAKIGSEDSFPLVYKMYFPEGVNPMFITSDMIDGSLLEFSIGKIRGYLMVRENAEYLRSKLKAVFREKPQQLKAIFQSIFSQGKQVLESILNPSDFSFQFWNHLANAIISEYRKKDNKLAHEHAYCQAAFLVGYYNMYYKGLQRQKRDQEIALKSVGQKLRAKPYFFTMQDIHNFKEKDGTLLAKKYAQNMLTDYLNKLTLSSDKKSLPTILQVKGEDKQVFYVSKEAYLLLTLQRISEVGVTLRLAITGEWKSALENGRKIDAMYHDDDFRLYVASKLRDVDPLATAMLKHNYLYLLVNEAKASKGILKEISTFFSTDRKSLRPVDEILKLRRDDLLANAKAQVPFWKRNPFLSGIVRFIAGLFGKKKRKPMVSIEKRAGSKDDISPVSGTLPQAKLVSYRKAVKNAQASFLKDGETVEKRLDDLAEQWNPLFDDQAKKNLVEDVNSLVRDHLRKLKRALAAKPPDRERAYNIAEQLADNDAFESIRKKGVFKEYLALYMLNQLGKR
jgi:hypothetical protein